MTREELIAALRRDGKQAGLEATHGSVKAKLLLDSYAIYERLATPTALRIVEEAYLEWKRGDA